MTETARQPKVADAERSSSAASAVETTVSPEQLDSDGLEPPTEGGSAGDDRPANREARYRVERNQARQERDALSARLTELQTQELHRLAGEHLAAAEDIGLSDKTLADYLTPEGWLDAEAVAGAAAEVIESRPGLAKNPKVRAVDRSQGSGDGSRQSAPEWSDLFVG
jgi:hypothetical protein